MKLEIELDDKGEFVGTLPPELGAVLERIRTTAHGEGFGKGNQKAAEEAKTQIASAIALEKAKWDAQLPIERQRWAEIEELNKHLKAQIEASTQQSRKAMTEREEAHAAEITRRAARESQRDVIIRELVAKHMRALAASAGAREDALPALEVVFQNRLGFDEDMNPFVRGEDGQPAKTTAGNALPLDVFVKQFLEANAFFRKPAPGQGGNARGGASMHGHTSHSSATLESARERVAAGDRSAGAITELYEAAKARRAS